MSPPMPGRRPGNPCFSTGPCSKRPGWSLDGLRGALLGRSHRSEPAKARLNQALDLTREVLGIPDDHRIAIVPASDTGAVELAMWSLLGERGVDVLAWESFGRQWLADILDQLSLTDTRVIAAPYGALPDLSRADFGRDVVFTWNGTTSGVRVPSADFIPVDRGGLTICDATSAAFAMSLDWAKLDVVTFSWQKVMGGEAAHGMLILGPRAVARLETYRPPWPLPKIFRLIQGGKLNEALFEGETINTPSMLCVEDYVDALAWAKRIGGFPALQARVEANAAALFRWVERTPWIDFLAQDPTTRSPTSVCLTIVDPEIASGSVADRADFLRCLVSALEREEVAFDIGAHRDAPPGLRIWCGATVETTDVEALTEWLDWAFASLRPTRAQEAA